MVYDKFHPSFRMVSEHVVFASCTKPRVYQDDNWKVSQSDQSFKNLFSIWFLSMHRFWHHVAIKSSNLRVAWHWVRGATGSWIIAIMRIIGQIIDCRHYGAEYIYRLRGVHLHCTQHVSRSGHKEKIRRHNFMGKKPMEPNVGLWWPFNSPISSTSTCGTGPVPTKLWGST